MAFNVLNQFLYFLKGVLGIALLLTIILLLKNWRGIIREIGSACRSSGLENNADKKGGDKE